MYNTCLIKLAKREKQSAYKLDNYRKKRQYHWHAPSLWHATHAMN